MQFSHLHFCVAVELVAVRARKGRGGDVPFLVSVPVLSLSRYSILPSSSGNVLVLTIVPGISGSFIIWDAYTVFPMSRFTRKLRGIPGVRTIHNSGNFNAYLMGMMDENNIRNLKTYTYHRPRKPLRATSTRDRTNVTVHKIWGPHGDQGPIYPNSCDATLASRLISRSSNPTLVFG